MTQPTLPTKGMRHHQPKLLSSMEGLQKHAWDTDQEHILKKWKCQLFVHMYMQGEARAYYRVLYNWLSTPVILINTAASAAIFVTNREDIRNYVLLAMTLSAAVLATLSRSMQVAELYQQHGSVCIRYCSLLHDIENVLNMRVDLRPSALSYIDKVKSDMDSIMSSQAEPPVHIVREFERTYGRIAGLFYGDDVVRVVLTNMRTNSYLNDIYMQAQPTSRVSVDGDTKRNSQSQVVFDKQERPTNFLPTIRSFFPRRPIPGKPKFLRMSHHTTPENATSINMGCSQLQGTYQDSLKRSIDEMRMSLDQRTEAGSINLDHSFTNGSMIDLPTLPVIASFMSTPETSDGNVRDDSVNSTMVLSDGTVVPRMSRGWSEVAECTGGSLNTKPPVVPRPISVPPLVSEIEFVLNTSSDPRIVRGPAFLPLDSMKT